MGDPQSPHKKIKDVQTASLIFAFVYRLENQFKTAPFYEMLL
jgi:hypothetical protein